MGRQVHLDCRNFWSTSGRRGTVLGKEFAWSYWQRHTKGSSGLDLEMMWVREENVESNHTRPAYWCSEEWGHPYHYVYWDEVE